MSNQETQTSLPKDINCDEFKRLQEENYILQGKIRGYLTLGNLLKEQKEECKKLMNEKKELLEKLNNFSVNTNSTANQNTDARDRSMDKIEEKNHENRPTTSVENYEVSNKEAEKVTKTSNNSRTSDLMSKHESIEVNKFNGTTENVGSSNGYAGHSNGSFSVSRKHSEIMNDVVYPPDVEFKDKFPMQESIGIENSNGTDRTDLNTSGSSSIVKIDPSSGAFSSDSIFGDRERQKIVSPKLTQQISNKAVYGSDVVSSSTSLNLMEFPSATEAVSDKRISSPVENILSIKERVSQVAEALDLTTDGPAEKMRKFLNEQIIPEISKQEEDLVKFKKCNEVLLRDLQKLKYEMKCLSQRNKHLEQQLTHSTPPESLSSQTQMVGWEYIKDKDIPKSESEGLVKAELPLDVHSKMAALQEQNNKLLDANAKWQAHWSQTKKDKEMLERLSAENEQLKQQIASFRTEDEKRQQDFDKILLTAKNRQSEAEAEKDEIQAQHAGMTLRLEEMQARLFDTDERLTQCRRDKQSLEAELTVLRNGNTRSLEYSPNRSFVELQTENAVLREQLSVFQEDFDRERTDRAEAQSSKDELKKLFENEKRKTATFQDKLGMFERQLRSAEENVKQTMAQNHSQQQEITSLKTKLRLERENNARVHNPYTVPPVGGFYQAPQGRQPQEQGMQPQAQPQTDPYAQPIPPYLFQTNRLGGSASQRPYQYTVSNRSQVAPEQLPGAWNCIKCTFVNHPGRSVCEICGHIHVPGELNGSYSANQSQPLMRRGELSQPNDVPDTTDLSNDSGNFAMN